MLVTTTEQAQRVLNRLRDHEGKLVIDVETSGLNPRLNHIVAYVLTFGGGDNTYYIPIRHARGGNIDNEHGVITAENWPKKQHWFEREFAKIAREKHWEVIGHNLMFDLLMCSNMGIYFPNCIFSCTQVAMAVVDELCPSFSLDASSNRMGVTAKKGDELYQHIIGTHTDHKDYKEWVKMPRKSMSMYWDTDGSHPLVVDYAVGDGVTTWELYHSQMEDIERQELHKIWNLEQRVTRVLFSLQDKGIKVNESSLRNTESILKTQAEEMRSSFKIKDPETSEDIPFNERSKSHLLQVFHNLGVTDDEIPRTDKGNISFTEEWLTTNEIGKKVIALRQCTNMLNSFVEPMFNRHLHNGRVYPGYNQLKTDDYGTVTGRLSSNNPNIQQVPKHNEVMSKLFRVAFEPDDGMVWSSNDFSQCEPRLFASYSGSDFLKQGYLKTPPDDLYTNLGKVTGIASRQTCKRLALALFYGAGNKKAAEMIGCTVEEATHYRQQIYNNIPEIKTFIDTATRIARKRLINTGVAFVKSGGGRKLRMGDERFLYKASNRIVQATNADLIKFAICEVQEYLESTGKGNVLLTCHDSIDWQYEEGAEDVNTECIRIMEECVRNVGDDVIPQKVDNGVGKNWAEATFGE